MYVCVWGGGGGEGGYECVLFLFLFFSLLNNINKSNSLDDCMMGRQ